MVSLFCAALCSAIVVRFSKQRGPDSVANSRIFFAFIVIQFIGLLAYIVSDLYRESASSDFLRGWARMVFVGVDLLGLATLIGTSWRRLVVLKVGFIFGVAAEAVIFGPLYGAWWKFGFAFPVTLLVFILVGNRGRWLASSVAIGLGLLNFSLDYRSLGAECFIVAIAVHLPRFNTTGRLLALMLVWALACALRTERPQQLLVIFLLVETLWNLAMTPFSGPKRIDIATAAILTLMLWQESRGRLFYAHETLPPASRGHSCLGHVSLARSHRASPRNRTRAQRPSNQREIALASFSSRSQFFAIEAEYRRALPATHPASVAAISRTSKILVDNE